MDPYEPAVLLLDFGDLAVTLPVGHTQIAEAAMRVLIGLSKCTLLACVTAAVFSLAACPAQAGSSIRIEGQIVDAATSTPLAARLYVYTTKTGQWFFAHSNHAKGQAFGYRKQRGRQSAEHHTVLSAHPFEIEVPPGEYLVTVERGKEYHTWQQTITATDEPIRLEIKLKRWTNLAAEEWYSGDTHVHRTLQELPTAMLADDLNVAYPLTDWITASGQAPRSRANDPPYRLIEVDATHVIDPRNTEYEIFSTAGRRHTLGAILLLGQKTRLEAGAPPIGPLAARVHREGGLVDLEKHSWPWSAMLVPVARPDLFELLNNHVWRTSFGFADWERPKAASYMKLETDEAGGWTEWGWIDFGLQTYYALVNCGFRLQPSAGTASGVHPVPLGFSRVYVHVPGEFSYEKWKEGLAAGRSFVTNGPVLLAKFNGQLPGHTFADLKDAANECHVTGTVEASQPIDRVELIVGGRVAETIVPEDEKTERGSYRLKLDHRLKLEGSSWVAVRAFEKHHENRVRIAHTAPVYFDVAGQPLRPRREEVEYFAGRVREEIERNRGVLDEASLDEYRQALAVYEKLLETAR